MYLPKPIIAQLVKEEIEHTASIAASVRAVVDITSFKITIEPTTKSTLTMLSLLPLFERCTAKYLNKHGWYIAETTTTFGKCELLYAQEQRS